MDTYKHEMLTVSETNSKFYSSRSRTSNNQISDTNNNSNK